VSLDVDYVYVSLDGMRPLQPTSLLLLLLKHTRKACGVWFRV
jgi:hypothetical protein